MRPLRPNLLTGGFGVLIAVPFMSRSLRPTISMPSRCWPNILAICSGVTLAALASSASAFLQCDANIGPLTAGVPFSGFVGSFVAYSPFSGVPVTIDWGDGTASMVATGRGNCRTDPITMITICIAGISGTHTYLPQPKHAVTITLRAGGGSCNDRRVQVLDGPPPPPPPGGDVLSNPSLLLGTAHLGVPVTGVIAMFNDSNPSPYLPDFTALIDWGDGTQSAGVVGGSSGKLSVSGDGHAYEQPGLFTVSVSLSAPGVASSTATGTVRVRRH
jgi:hypothetical protein